LARNRGMIADAARRGQTGCRAGYFPDCAGLL